VNSEPVPIERDGGVGGVEVPDNAIETRKRGNVIDFLLRSAWCLG
jgi:hypothetical protein